jgi:hypothetical protein
MLRPTIVNTAFISKVNDRISVEHHVCDNSIPIDMVNDPDFIEQSKESGCDYLFTIRKNCRFYWGNDRDIIKVYNR